MDAQASPPSPPAYVYAANDQRPRGAREEELCEQASHPDYLYLGGTFAVAIGTMYLEAHWLKFMGYDNQVEPNTTFGPGARLIGPTLVGLTWGFFVGGAYLAKPKCSPDWAPLSPPEGSTRSPWLLAIALAGVAGATAPVLDYYALGTVPAQWPVWERSLRVITAGATGVVGAFLPYLLPPRTWRATRELERIRVSGDATGGALSYTLRF